MSASALGGYGSRACFSGAPVHPFGWSSERWSSCMPSAACSTSADDGLKWRFRALYPEGAASRGACVLHGNQPHFLRGLHASMRAAQVHTHCPLPRKPYLHFGRKSYCERAPRAPADLVTKRSRWRCSSSQTGSGSMLWSRNWCSGAHGCNEGHDVWQHLRAHAQRQQHTVLEQPEIRRSGRPAAAS